MAEYRKEKFFWIKLKQSLMTSAAVDFLMSQKDGANYVVLYQCLCLNTVNNNGELADRIGEIIVPYDEVKIQRETKWFTIDTIRVALSLYEKLGLIYRQENGILKISNFEDLIGSQTISAYKKELQIRNRGGNEGGQKVEKNPLEIEKEIEIDKELDLEIDKDSNSDWSNNHKEKETKEKEDEEEVEGITFHQDSKEKELVDMFEEFWQAYPRKVAKKTAFTAFKNVKHLKEEFPLIMEHVRRKSDSNDWTKQGGQFVPHPTTYLHQERWKDEEEDPYDYSNFNSDNPFFSEDVKEALRRMEK